jgi:eukaryotic-like serine/threonine-protein kinase
MAVREALPHISRDFTEPSGGGMRRAADDGYYVTNSGGDGRVMIGRDVEIFPNKPLDAFASFETRAFEAKDVRETAPQLALLCGRSRGPRITALGTYQSIKSPHLLKLRSAGVVHWKPEGRQLFALVFDMPPAKRLMQPDGSNVQRISGDRIMTAMIAPAIEVLRELNTSDIVHGGLSPENIFLAGAEGSEMAILGECVSSAPGFRLNIAFETIERSMAQPSGRGPGTVKNDLYTLGISVVIALRGFNPFAGKTAEQILNNKIEHGTYACVVGSERISSDIVEFLRGVLHDNENDRWGLDDALRWLEGRRLSAKPPHITLTASRPYIFRDRKYWDLRTLAVSFAAHTSDASAALEKDNFSLWLKRNFEDRDLETRIDKCREKEEGSSRERVVSSFCLALDPLAPVRYKGTSIFPSGFGTALADAMARDEDVQTHAELIALQLFNNWVNQRFEEIIDASTVITVFEKCRNFLAQKMPGYGMERIVYLLNKETVCLSGLLRDYYVLSPGHLLMALEGIAKSGKRPDQVLDRHMISFISVREPKMIDPHLGHIISHDRAYQLIGIVRTLAAIQRRFQIAPVPALGDWLISLMAPAVERFHDQDLRQQVLQKLSTLTDSGNLNAILEMVDSPALVQDDQQRYAVARREFALLSREGMGLANQLSRKKTFGLVAGRQVAMLVSSVIAACSLLAIVAAHFWWD